MEPIFQACFAENRLPAGWYTDTPYPRYGGGAWDCRPGDGAIVMLPHDAWVELRIEIEVDDVGASATAFCGLDSRSALWLSLCGDEYARHQATDSGRVLAEACTPLPPAQGSRRLTFHWSGARFAAAVDGREIVAADNLRQSARAGTLQLGFRNCVVRSIGACGVAETAGLATVPQETCAIETGYPLEVTVDFNDDLMACAWTQETFNALFAELKSWGTRRVSWIDLGRARDGYFDFAPLNIGPHAEDTMREVGDIFTTAVETAHRHDIELIGLFKPFDMAIAGYTFPPHSEPALRHGRIHQIGGSTCWATHMAADNQDLVMARRPDAHGAARQKVWTRIDLVKEDDRPSEITAHDIRLLVSDNNEFFRPYDGPIKIIETIEDYPLYKTTPSGPRPDGHSRRARVIRLDQLQLCSPFVAIEVHGVRRSFVNTLLNLVHIYGAGGEETHFTYGLTPRKADHMALFHQSPAEVQGESVGPQGGFEFNRYPGSPSSALTCSNDAIQLPLALDRGAPAYIALARGKDRGPLAVLSASFPRTRELWLSWLEAMLDSGADGIDIRLGHHHADFSWGEYGFEQPVRDEMLRRSGVDVWQTDDFDYELWRRIRGEGLTQFLREASALVRGRGKPLTLHIESHVDNAPGTGGAMHIDYDWRGWLREGLANRVTGKSLWPGQSFSRDVVSLAHSLGITVSYAPYCNNFFEDRMTMNHVGGSPVGCEVPVNRLIELGREYGYDSFVFYECASALRATPEGTIRYRQPGAPALRQVMQRHFAQEPDCQMA